MDNDLRTIWGERVIIDISALKRLVSYHPCEKSWCSKSIVIEKMLRCNLVAQAKCRCLGGHNFTLHFDGFVNRRYQITFDFILATTMFTPAKTHFETALTVFGLSLPKKQNEIKLIGLMKQVAKRHMKDELRARIAELNQRQREPQISSDTQYIRPQKKTIAMRAMTTYLDNKTHMIVHHEFVHRGEVATVHYQCGPKRVQTYHRSDWVGEVRGLKYLKQVLLQTPFIIHDECGVAARLIAHHFGPGREIIDYFHKKQKVAPDFIKMAKQLSTTAVSSELHHVGVILTTHFVHICTDVPKQLRVQAWLKLEKVIHMGGIPKGKELLKAFLKSYERHMKKCSLVDCAITGYNKSLHAHNLRFWTKYIYQSRLNHLKQLCAHLSWNCVVDWPSKIRDEVFLLSLQ